MMDVTHSVAELIDSTSSRIQQLQKAFSELESHRAISLNFKWKELEEHFQGLQRSLKRRFVELEDQEKEFENKKFEAKEMLEKCEASVVANEQASLNRLQEKRDAAVLAIAHVLDKDKPSNCGIYEKIHDKSSLKCDTSYSINSVGCANMEEKCISLLGKLCKEMDSTGLHRFISENRKNLSSVKEALPRALEMACDPAILVVNLLEDFYRIEDPTVDVKKDSDLLGLRRTCIMLMECLTILLMGMPSGTGSPPILVSEDAKERARALAKNWELKLADLDVDDSNGNSLEAHAFLQLLVTFGIFSEFNEEELFRLVPAVSRRRQAPDLYRMLGISQRMPGVIEALINSRRHINAVNLVISFGLTEQFSPVDLLNSYLKAVKDCYSPSRSGNASPSANDTDDRELAAYKGVVKCVETNKLGALYPLEPLHKHIVLLEKAKVEKKVSEAAKPQPKRPRASMPSLRPRLPNIIADKNLYPRVRDGSLHLGYDRPCAYPLEVGNPPAPPYAYNFTSTAHGNYFGTPYHYHPQYLF